MLCIGHSGSADGGLGTAFVESLKQGFRYVRVYALEYHLSQGRIVSGFRIPVRETYGCRV